MNWLLILSTLGYAIVGIFCFAGILFFLLLAQMKMLFLKAEKLRQILSQEEIKLLRLLQMHDYLLANLTRYLDLTQQEIYGLVERISLLPIPIIHKK